MSIESHYDKSAIIKYHDGTVDAWNKPDFSTANWDTLATQACMLRPTTTREEFKAGKEYVYRDAIMYTAYNSSVTEAMTVTINSVVYHITHIKDPNSRGHHMEVSLLKIV